MFLIFACKATEKEATKKDEEITAKSLQEEYDKDPSRFTKRILAGKCRIEGIVVKINPKIYSDDPGDPCSKAPCKATIKIEEILGYGAGFSKTLSQGEEIDIMFKFTLSPSRDVSPQLQLDLPGLKVGARFIADVESNPSIKKGEDEFTIYRYELK